MANLRVLHYTTWQTPCGIAGYAESLVNALGAQGVRNTVHGICPKQIRAMASSELLESLAAFSKQAREHDVVHIQHDFAFFTAAADLIDSNQNFHLLLERLAESRTPTVITIHTEPPFLSQPAASPAPLGRRARLRRMLTPGARRRMQLEKTQGWRLHEVMRVRPHLLKLIVHAQKTRAALAKSGVPAGQIEVVPIGFDMPAPQVQTLDRAQAKQALGLPPDCVLLSLFGFVAKYKGHEVAVKALKTLPEKYVLAVVGGPHPEGDG
jgi:glycosyltransferase involved in cell wall biosynthesis